MCVYLRISSLRPSCKIRALTYIYIYADTPFGRGTKSLWRLRFAHGPPTLDSLSTVSHLHPRSISSRDRKNSRARLLDKGITEVSIPRPFTRLAFRDLTAIVCSSNLHGCLFKTSAQCSILRAAGITLSLPSLLMWSYASSCLLAYFAFANTAPCWA